MDNYLSIEDVEQLRKVLKLPTLEFILRPTWGSLSSSHRQEIHSHLEKRKHEVHDICASSISHCRSLGGFAFSAFAPDQKIQLGFDVEEDLRVTDEIARRICKSSEEFSVAPSAVSLWTAKEAAFKVLKGPLQPRVVSEIELRDWNILSSQIETVWIKSGQGSLFSSALGVVLKKKPYTFAVFVSFL